jgi:hypothetical protein
MNFDLKSVALLFQKPFAFNDLCLQRLFCFYKKFPLKKKKNLPENSLLAFKGLDKQSDFVIRAKAL